MIRALPAAAAAALLVTALQAPAATQVWRAEGGEGTAALVTGQPGTANSFRLDCSAKGMSLSTWTTRLPRNISEGEFPSRLSVFQGNREIVLGGTGRVLPTGGTRVDALVENPQAFLDGMGRNSRFVVVNFSGRGTAPAPTAEQLKAHGDACRALRP
jgi:hypothetical protein